MNFRHNYCSKDKCTRELAWLSCGKGNLCNPLRSHPCRLLYCSWHCLPSGKQQHWWLHLCTSQTGSNFTRLSSRHRRMHGIQSWIAFIPADSWMGYARPPRCICPSPCSTWCIGQRGSRWPYQDMCVSAQSLCKEGRHQPNTYHVYESLAGNWGRHWDLARFWKYAILGPKAEGQGY